MYCRECGAELKEGHRFCENCGAPVRVRVGADKIRPEVKPGTKSETKSNRMNSSYKAPKAKGKIFVWVTVAALACGTFAFAGMHFFPKIGSDAGLN